MPYPSDDTQICSRCSQDLPISRFSRNGKKNGYRRPECRSCQHNRSKEINSNYQHTEGAVAARASHDMKKFEVDRAKRQLLLAQQNECKYCTATLEFNTCHLDHRTPISRGGTNAFENLQVLCARCNFEKHSKNDEEYIEWLYEVDEHLNVDRRGKLD